MNFQITADDLVAPWWVRIWPLANILIMCVLLVFGIYVLVLFIKFAKLGIKAFSIYIEKNNHRE